jgi:hypothetical protein
MTAQTPPCFTPPFHARKVHQSDHDGKPYIIAAIETETHMPIANVFHPTCETNDNEQTIMATAHLFAAAPELLAALKSAQDWMRSIPSDKGDPDYETKRNYRHQIYTSSLSAIAKAESK